MNATYTVPIIPKNLSKNEAIVQIAELLDHLSTVSEDLFKKIDARLESNKTRLNNITERVDNVHTKIGKLKGAKNATQVFSSSKYPANDVNKDYISIFENTEAFQIKRHKIKHKNYVSNYEPIDKISSYQNRSETRQRKVKYDGLGDMPIDIDCVNDLLLYNSGKNLYKNFEISDALKGPQHIREEDNVDVSDIGVAPYSIREGASMNKSNVQQYFYAPKIGEVPELDVPLDLPDLPGIADDLRYENDNAPTIAPSALASSVLAELPVIEEPVKEDVPIDLPPPPPLPKVEPVVEVIKEEPKEPIVIPQAPPVPEVLPRPPTPKQEEEPQKKVDKLPGPAIDARASLMEAIRQAGGSNKAKLKSVVKERPKEVNKPPVNIIFCG